MRMIKDRTSTWMQRILLRIIIIVFEYKQNLRLCKADGTHGTLALVRVQRARIVDELVF